RADLFKDMKHLFQVPDVGMFLELLHIIQSAKTSGLAGRLGAVLRSPEKDLTKPSVLQEIMEPRAAKPGKARQHRPPSPDGANGKQPPPELTGTLDVLLERMAMLDKLQAGHNAANGNGHAHS